MRYTAVIDATCVRPDRLTGIERVTREATPVLVRAMDEYDWIVIVREDADWIPEVDARIIRIRASSRIGLEQVHLPRALFRNRPALGFFPGFPPPVWLPRRMRVISIVHDATLWDLPHDLSRGARYFYKPSLQASLRLGRIQLVLSVSMAAAHDVRQHVPRSIPVVGIPLGTSMSPVVGEDLPREPFALAVGTVEPRKNYGVLFQAIAQLVEEGLEIPLKVVGRAGWGVASAPPPAAAPLIEFLGRIDDAELEQLYRRCRCYAMPSRYEGFGLPLLEAMHYGARCIASDIPVLREVGGTAVTYAGPDSAAAWVDALRGIWSGGGAEPAQVRAQAAQFSWDRWASAAALAIRTALLAPSSTSLDR